MAQDETALGFGPDDGMTLADAEAAFRRLAMQHHRDRAGASGTQGGVTPERKENN